MNQRTVLVPRGQLSSYQIGFEGEVRTMAGEFIRTERTTAIDSVASTVTKTVIRGSEYGEDGAIDTSNCFSMSGEPK